LRNPLEVGPDQVEGVFVERHRCLF
jgi:hypothetical protein